MPRWHKVDANGEFNATEIYTCGALPALEKDFTEISK